MSETFGGIGSVAISAVPVLEKTNATSGQCATACSTASCIAVDASSDVLGMRMACIAMSFSSSVGMNSWPSRVNKNSETTKTATAPQITKPCHREGAHAGSARTGLRPRMSGSPSPAPCR